MENPRADRSVPLEYLKTFLNNHQAGKKRFRIQIACASLVNVPAAKLKHLLNLAHCLIIIASPLHAPSKGHTKPPRTRAKAYNTSTGCQYHN